MSSCFMFGHADCPNSMLPKIEQAIEHLCLDVRCYNITAQLEEDVLKVVVQGTLTEQNRKGKYIKGFYVSIKTRLDMVLP